MIKKYWIAGLFLSILFFFGVPFSFAYFTTFLISPEEVNVSLSVLETSQNDFTVSLDPDFDYYENGEAPYKISRFTICDEYDDDYNCIIAPPDLCPYISLTPKDGESIDVGFNLKASVSYPEAKGQLNIPGDEPRDETDNWTLSITSPCFAGECPSNYNSQINGQPLFQDLKGQTFVCDLGVFSTDRPVLIKGIRPKTANAEVSAMMRISAVFTGEGGVTKLDPVIIIPGILGSSQKNGEWVIDPIMHVYDDLIDTLEANGYEKNKTLFTMPYDWHNSNVVTEVSLRDKIAEVQEICDCDKVDIVAHSMGGLVARYYIQSPLYKQDVDQLIFLGTPHLGSPKAYLTWEAGESSPDLFDELLNYVFYREAKKANYNNVFDYVHNKPVSSLQELLPGYSYLKDKNSRELLNYPTSYPRNYFLENLNAGVSNLFNSGVRISNIIGDTGTSTINIIRVSSSTDPILWEHGIPDGFYSATSTDNGLEKGLGDGTVPLESARFINSQLTVTGYNHTELPTKAEGLVYKILTNKDATVLIDKKRMPNFVLVIKMLSPADIQIIAPDGKKIGKNFETGGEFNEIDGAFYSGFGTDDEYVTIPNPLDGEYKVVTQGTGGGGGYTLATGYISDNVSTESDFTGQTLPGMINEVNVEISSSSPEIIEVTPEDDIPPVITVISPEARDYPRSESFVINATSTDADSGVFKFEVSLVPLETELASSSLSGIDPFYEKLGNHLFFATSTDFMNNIATSSIELRFIATASSTISDIERAYSLGWITKKQVKDSLIKQLKAIMRIEKRIEWIEEKLKDGTRKQKRVERFETKIDKILGRAWQKELRLYMKSKFINKQAHDLLNEDIEWLLENY